MFIFYYYSKTTGKHVYCSKRGNIFKIHVIVKLYYFALVLKSKTKTYVASCIMIIFKESDFGKSHSFSPTEIIYTTIWDVWILILFKRIISSGLRTSGFSTSTSIPSIDECTWSKYLSTIKLISIYSATILSIGGRYKCDQNKCTLLRGWNVYVGTS